MVANWINIYTRTVIMSNQIFNRSRKNSILKMNAFNNVIYILEYNQWYLLFLLHSYETGNNIIAEESGYLKTVGEGEDQSEALVQQGSYSYTSPEGQLITIHYTADETGFHATGDHIPTPPPVSEEIQKGLDLIYAGIRQQQVRIVLLFFLVISNATCRFVRVRTLNVLEVLWERLRRSNFAQRTPFPC